MKSINEINAAIDKLSRDDFDLMLEARWDDRPTLRKILRKIHLTVADFERWEEDEEPENADFDEEDEDEDEDEDEITFAFTITAKEANDLMRGEYLDALAHFANILADAEDPAEAAEVIDHEMWSKIKGLDEQERWLAVYSGLLTAIG